MLGQELQEGLEAQPVEAALSGAGAFPDHMAPEFFPFKNITRDTRLSILFKVMFTTGQKGNIGTH